MNVRLPMISVIIPIYNAEIYLRRCLDSVVCQAYTDLEIILINDGSVDGSGEICGEYAEHDKRIKVINEENRGVSAARNIGLRVAQGEYVCFVDADDEVDVNYVQYLYSLMITNEADVSACSVMRVREQKDRRNIDKENRDCVEKVFTQNEALVNMIYKKDLTGYSVAKLMKREIINNIYFEEKLKVAEDFAFVFDVLIRAGKVVYGGNSLYIYYQNSGSCMHDKDWTKYQVTWSMFVDSEGKYYKLGREVKAAFINYLFVGALGFYSQIDLSDENVGFINGLVDYIKENRKKVLNNKEGKNVHRLLALLCCLNARWGCEICKIVVKLNRALNIQVKKTI